MKAVCRLKSMLPPALFSFPKNPHELHICSRATRRKLKLWVAGRVGASTCQKIFYFWINAMHSLWSCHWRLLRSYSWSECYSANSYGWTSICPYNASVWESKWLLVGFWMQFKITLKVIIFKILHGFYLFHYLLFAEWSLFSYCGPFRKIWQAWCAPVPNS